jgi:hypothetical protein
MLCMKDSPLARCHRPDGLTDFLSERQALKQHLAPTTAEGLLCTDDGYLLEGMITNFFVVTGKDVTIHAMPFQSRRRGVIALVAVRCAEPTLDLMLYQMMAMAVAVWSQHQ